MLRKLLAGLAIAGAGFMFTADSLIAQSDLAAIVTERKDIMKSMSASFRPLVAVLKDESTDLSEAAVAARLMNDGIVEASKLFPEGTAKGEVEGSRAKPEIWTERAEFDAAANALIEASAKLVVAANAGDVDAFKALFPMVGQTCAGCHEGSGKDGGKFRFPKE